MMYFNKFVCVIKVAGKVLRESGDLVKLPYGSEFSVLVKNLSSRRAKFRLSIDGQDVLDGTEIVVNANSEVEMKRFIQNGNMDIGNAFKFIERTEKIENGPRGIRVDDGIVRIEYWFEKESKYIDEWKTYPYKWKYGKIDYIQSCGIQSAYKETLLGSGLYNSVVSSSACAQNAVAKSDIGITVPGSPVEQKFHSVYGFDVESQSHVIILRLSGKTALEEALFEPVTVKTKQKCTTCGLINKATSKFCAECGTSLQLF